MIARALDTDVSVVAAEAGVRDLVAVLMSMYAPAIGPASLEYRLERERIERNGECIGEYRTCEEMTRAFEAQLYRDLVETARPSFLVHGGAVVPAGDPERAIVLFGASGAGKTTMCSELIARGARYVSDEYLAIDERCCVRGVPRPFWLGRIANDPLLPIAKVHNVQLAVEDGRAIEVDLLTLGPERVCHAETRVCTIVHLRRGEPGEAAGARPLRASEALSMLWSERHRFGREELEMAIALLREVPAFELVTQTIDGAARDIEALVGVTT